jgi:hypothetical protein
VLSDWITIEGIIQTGHQVASGRGNSPYPASTIEMQRLFFAQLGLDLSVFFAGTLNVSIAPASFMIQAPEYCFRQIHWTTLHPPEDFSFSRCWVTHDSIDYPGLVYYPHPETKQTHFQTPSTIEILAPLIPNLHYSDPVQLKLNPLEIKVFGCLER